MKSRYVFLTMAMAMGVSGQAKVTLAPIFGNGMVLQRNAKVLFSGMATPQRTVEISTSWDGKKYRTRSDADGKWTLTVPTASAGGPFTMTFSDGERLVLSDLLLGDVWFCSGQSNMEMPVKGFRGQPTAGSLPYIAAADGNRPLRLFSQEHAWNTRPQTSSVKGEWRHATSDAVADFSAVGYFFGNRLQKNLGVPVGLVNCSWSMSTIQAWMSRESLEKFPEVKLPDYEQTNFGWTEGTPTLLYNGMVNPWKGFPVKGVVWYQGEANTPEPMLYEKLFPEMVSQWRKHFGNDEMPFYYVQLVPFQAVTDDDTEWAWFRQVQSDLQSKVSGVTMITTADCGDEKFIHTPHKIKIGERIADVAMAKTYGQKGIADAPSYKSAHVENGAVIVEFNGGEDGLTPELQNVEGFELVDSAGNVVKAQAEIVRSTNQVKVWSDAVKNPVEVRYGFHNYYKAELCNNLGLPASPFRAVLKRKRAYLWIDAEANLARFATRDSIDFYCKRIREAGFTDIVVDVRPITGEVLYDSKYAPRMTEWGGKKAADFDYLGYFIEQGKKNGLGVLASMNTFCAGHNYFDRGLVYSQHPEWASVVYNPERGLIPITQEKEKYGGMVNPNDTAYQSYIINIMKEIATKYPQLEGIVTDRVRFDGITADFSDMSRKAFEKYVGKRLQRFPEDIFEWCKGTDGKPVMKKGKYFKQWIEWRSMVISDFMARARKEVKAANPRMGFDTYTGAWYPSYYEVGVNFADPSYNPAADFDWATAKYQKTGYIRNIDTYFTGNYYTDVTVADYLKTNKLVKNETDLSAQSGDWYCVEGSCRHLRSILGGHPFVGGVLVDQFYDNPARLSATIAENLKDADGLMVFDLVHIVTKNLWNEIEAGLWKGGLR